MATKRQPATKLEAKLVVGRNKMRYISLVCLTLQTTIIITLYSYSRIVPKDRRNYLSSTVVVLAEILKLAFCFVVILKDSGGCLYMLSYTLSRPIYSSANNNKTPKCRNRLLAKRLPCNHKQGNFLQHSRDCQDPYSSIFIRVTKQPSLLCSE